MNTLLAGETNTNNAYEIGTIADAKPGDYTDDGWVLLESSTVNIDETHTVEGRYVSSSTTYYYEETFSCSVCGGTYERSWTNSGGGASASSARHCNKTYRVSGSPKRSETHYTEDIWMVLDNGTIYDLGSCKYYYNNGR